MSLIRESRSEKKLKAVLRYRFRLKQRLEYIDWEFDEFNPTIELMKAGKPVLGLSEGAEFDIIVQHEVPDQTEAAKPEDGA